MAYKQHTEPNPIVSDNILFGRRVSGFLALIRFPSTITTAILVVLLAICHAAVPLSVAPIILAAFSYLLLSGAGFAINDYYDIDIDAINKPHRPIPAGIIGARTALVFYFALLAGCIVTSLFVNKTFAVMAISNSLLISMYSVYFKRHGGFSANILMGGYAALFVFSGVSVLGKLSVSVFLGTSALCLYMVGNQIVMCIEDIEGDRQQGARTLPVRFGIGKSLVLALILMVAGLSTTVATYRSSVEILPLIGILGVNLYIFFRLFVSPTPQVAGKIRVFMPVSMTLTVIVIILRGPLVIGMN